jgi:hypothetical protein
MLAKWVPIAACLTDTSAQHTSCCVGLWDGLLEHDPQWFSAAGGMSWTSSGCKSSRPFLRASCTSSGCTAMLSSFWRFGRARSTVSRYLQRTSNLTGCIMFYMQYAVHVVGRRLLINQMMKLFIVCARAHTHTHTHTHTVLHSKCTAFCLNSCLASQQSASN